MGAERDTKAFFLSPIAAGIPRAPHGFSACQAAAAAPTPLQRRARGEPVLGQQQPAPVACVLNRAGACELPEDGDRGRTAGVTPEPPAPSSRPPRPAAAAARISNKFWSAGEYEAPGESSAQPPRNLQNRMCVHPKFLHSNATSHKWPLGAVAELLDNAVDEIKTGATKIIVDKIVDSRNGSPALLVQDDGGGMDPDSMRRCMSFGFSDKQSGSTIGQYGNGFKTSTMRLGADVIVFSRCMKNSEPTQSIGLLSYTFLSETGQKDVVVPMVDYKCNLMTGQAKPCPRNGPDQFSANLSVLLKWSPFATEEQLMQNFSDIGPHGTKIIVFNLWSNDDGGLELDFDTKAEDIMISGAPKTGETNHTVKRMNENHMSNQLHYSLRVYASILYLQLPVYFKIILRGQEVMRHSIASDLKYCQCISYKPQSIGRKEIEAVTTIGFLEGAPSISVHGFNIYHKNRLILPFHRVLSNSSSKGRGVVGVLEADFIKPTHDKQDFEKSQVYQRLITRLKEMTTEYWDLYSYLVGYHKVPRGAAASRAVLPTLPEAGTIAKPSKQNADAPMVSVAASRPNTSDNPSIAVPIAFAPPVAPGTPDIDLADTRKRRMETDVQASGSSKRQVTHALAGNNSMNSTNKFMGERELKEYCFLKQENKLLQEECMAIEMADKELLLKEQKLRLEIEQAKAQYKNLLNEYVSVTSVKTTQKR